MCKSCCRTDTDKSPTSEVEFLKYFHKAYHELCVDYAYLEEFISRYNPDYDGFPTPEFQSARTIFYKMQASLILGVARLADGAKDSLSLQKFKEVHKHHFNTKIHDKSADSVQWKRAFDDWMEGPPKATILLYRDEHLGHALPAGRGRRRTRSRVYAESSENSDGAYKHTHGEILKASKDAIVLTRWLTEIIDPDLEKCYSGQNGAKLAAEREVDREIARCRKFHGSLLCLIP